MSIRIDTQKLRGMLASHSHEGKEKPSVSGLLYGPPPSLAGKAASQSIIEFLAESPVLQGLTKKELSLLAAVTHERSYGDGETIFNQGSHLRRCTSSAMAAWSCSAERTERMRWSRPSVLMSISARLPFSWMRCPGRGPPGLEGRATCWRFPGRTLKP